MELWRLSGLPSPAAGEDADSGTLYGRLSGILNDLHGWRSHGHGKRKAGGSGGIARCWTSGKNHDSSTGL